MRDRRVCDGCKCKVEGPLRLTRTLDDRDVIRLCHYCLQDHEADRKLQQQAKGAA